MMISPDKFKIVAFLRRTAKRFLSASNEKVEDINNGFQVLNEGIALSGKKKMLEYAIRILSGEKSCESDLKYLLSKGNLKGNQKIVQECYDYMLEQVRKNIHGEITKDRMNSFLSSEKSKDWAEYIGKIFDFYNKKAVSPVQEKKPKDSSGTFLISNGKLILSIFPERLNSILKSSDYTELMGYVLGSIGGTADFTRKNGKAIAEFLLDGQGSESKQHLSEIKECLKNLKLEEEEK